MLEAIKGLFSPSTSRNDSPSAPLPSASNLVQVLPSSSSSAQVGVGRSAEKSISLEELMQRGGLRTVSGYTQSLKGWVSGKVSNAIHSVVGRQAALNPFGRSDALTFRALERLVANAQNTAIASGDNPASKTAHRNALIALGDALQQYADNKDRKLSNVVAVLKGLDEAIEVVRPDSIPVAQA